MVECEEALDAEMAAAEDLLVEVGAKVLEVVETVGHGSSCLREAGGWDFAMPEAGKPRLGVQA